MKLKYLKSSWIIKGVTNFSKRKQKLYEKFSK